MRQYGLVGSLRLDFDCVTVMEKKEYMVEPTDLRLNSPFPELRAYVDAFDLDALELDRHSHVPYPVILLKALDKYRSATGSTPSNFKEKQEFKDTYVKGLAKDFGKEINFAEALKNAFLLFQTTELNDELKEIFESE